MAQPLPSVAVEPPAKPKKKATAKAAPASAKATRQDMQQLVRMLDGLASAKRPVHKDMLLVLLQTHLGEPSVQAPRVLHALAQLQARKRVVLRKDVVSYPPAPVGVPVSAKKAVAKKTAATAAPTITSQPTAAQVAQAVLANLKKMPKNKPTRRMGLLKHIEIHAAKATDPKAMAQQVCALLEARQDVVVHPDGMEVRYPRLASSPRRLTSEKPAASAQTELQNEGRK